MSKKVWIIGQCLFIAILLITLIYCSTSQSLWMDEVFSLNLVDHSWMEMFDLAKADVHPPFYYVILKLFILIGGRWTDNVVFLGKLCSSIPFFLCFLLLGRKIEKSYGKLVAGLFCIFLAGMPNVLDYAVEIRGYAWGMFFVTGAYLTGENINSQDKWYRSWMPFTLYAVLAAYVHYFACFAVGVIYIGLLIRNFRKTGFVKKWVISVLAAVVAYLPWLFIFLSQLKTVIGDYWIEEVTLQSIYSYFRFLFEPRMDTFHVDMICGILLAVSYFALLILAFKNRKCRVSNWGLWGSMVLIVTVLFGVAASLLIRPIFVARYMIVAIGCFWFCYAWMIGENKKKKILVVLSLAVSLVIICIDIGQFVRWEHRKKEYCEETMRVIRQIDSNDIVLTEGKYTQDYLSWYLGKREILKIEELEDILEKSDFADGTVIWCFDTEDGEDIPVEAIKDKNLEVEELGQYHLEYDTFSIIRVIL